MAKSTISRYSVPWQSYHDSLRELAGDGVESVVRIMREHTIRYGEPLATSLKGTRSTIQQLLSPRMKYKRLCKGTIIIIPRNLVSDLLQSWKLGIWVLIVKSSHNGSMK